MSDGAEHLSREVVIVNELGLHARSAAKIAEIAQKAVSNVWILRQDHDAVDAKSIIDMLTLACTKGTRIIVRIEDASDAAVLNEIVELVDCGFGE